MTSAPTRAPVFDIGYATLAELKAIKYTLVAIGVMILVLFILAAVRRP
jgi:uncharacterized membrane protein (Fun14 family)